MNVVIAFSGEVDSTLLLVQNLEKGNHVFPVFVDLYPNSKNRYEKEFAEKLIKVLQKRYPNNLSYLRVVDHHVNSYYHSFRLSQPVVWTFSLAIFCASFNQDIDEVQIGYISNDCAISYLEEIQNLWDCIYKFIQPTLQKPKLSFPLTKITKEEIYIEIQKKGFEKILHLFPFCEANAFETKLFSCGTCPSCGKVKFLQETNPYMFPKKFLDIFKTKEENRKIKKPISLLNI